MTGANERFGKILMRRVRDEAISDWDMILSGKMKDEESRAFAKQVKTFSPEVRAFLDMLIPRIVDTTLHHLLWTLEQETTMQLLVKDGSGEPVNVAEESDGLAGDLYDWRPKFSKERFDENA